MHRSTLIVSLCLMVSLSTATSPAFGQRPSRRKGSVRLATPVRSVNDRTASAVDEAAEAARPADASAAATSTGAAKVRVLDHELTEMPDGVAGAPQAIAGEPLIVLSDQEIARGSALGTTAASATVLAEAVVYANTFDQGNWTVNGQRFSFTPTMSSTVVNSAGFSIPTNLGTFIADDMTLGGGWQLGDQISSFSAFVRRSGFDQTRGIGDGTASATVTLWDGDPINAIDTTGDGFASAPIPGASCDFTLSPDVPFATLQKLNCNLATPITPPHDNVWMVLTSDSCRLFWSITLLTPTVGQSRDLGIISQDDDAGELGSLTNSATATDGNCCAGGGACGPGAVDQFCFGALDNNGGRCSDGDAETHLSFNFGGPCVGDFDTDSCVNYLAEIKSPTETTMSLIPIGATGPHTIDGNTITVQPGSAVIMEVHFASWDPDGDGTPKLSAWLACLEDPDATGKIVPLSRTCAADDDCFSLFGGVCDITGESCNLDSDCPAAPVEICKSRSRCGTTYAGDACAAGFIDTLRPDYVFAGLREASAVAFGRPLDCRIASALNGSLPVADPGVPRYAATIGVTVSPDALGEFTFGPSQRSSLIDENSGFIAPIGLVPTTIIVATDPFLTVRKNRYLTIVAGQPGVSQAIRVTFVDLPGAFSVLNGSSRWVGAPFDLSENGHSPGPGIRGFADFKAASLQCDPFFMDWSTVGGVVEVLHEDVVPSGTYEITVFNEGNLTAVVSSSTVVMGRWGDLVGPFDQENQVWSAPDGTVDVVFDVVALIQSFSSAATMARKVRMDIDPATPNGGIDIMDIVRTLDAFRGRPYPFAPTLPPCGP